MKTIKRGDMVLVTMSGSSLFSARSGRSTHVCEVLSVATATGGPWFFKYEDRVLTIDSNLSELVSVEKITEGGRGIIPRVISKAFFGVGGVLLIVMAVWGEVTNTSSLSPMARLVFWFLGFALFIGAFRPPEKKA